MPVFIRAFISLFTDSVIFYFIYFPVKCFTGILKIIYTLLVCDWVNASFFRRPRDRLIKAGESVL